MNALDRFRAIAKSNGLFGPPEDPALTSGHLVIVNFKKGLKYARARGVGTPIIWIGGEEIMLGRKVSIGTYAYLKLCESAAFCVTYLEAR